MPSNPDMVKFTTSELLEDYYATLLEAEAREILASHSPVGSAERAALLGAAAERRQLLAIIQPELEARGALPKESHVTD